MTAARLPQAWVEVLDELRTDELPEGQAFPLDLFPIEAAAVAGVSDPRGWEALKVFHAHREPLEIPPGRWNLTCERVRQDGGHEAPSRCACLGRGLGGGRMRSRRLTLRFGGRLA